MKSRKYVSFVCAMVTCCTLLSGVVPMEAQAAKKKVNKADISYVSMVFDADYYYNHYSDVADAIGNDPAKLLDHYLNYGINEGRNASESFNATNYRYNYADLNTTFGDNMIAYCRHYAEYGQAEGRNAKDQLVTPPVTAEAGNVIASYTTKFDAKIARATNVKLAASQINGKVLEPGETFSFLGSITPRTKENGYVVAPVFVSGKVSKGIGGGICQVSSTIYAAVLGTDCTIVERHSHSLPVSYVPKGMDATVSSPSLDFRFTNTYEQPMLISITASDEGELTVTLSLQ